MSMCRRTNHFLANFPRNQDSEMASPVSPSGIGLRDSWVATLDLEVTRDPDGESPNPLSPCTPRSPVVKRCRCCHEQSRRYVRPTSRCDLAQAPEPTTYGKLLQVACV